ncbi:MAG: dienelactone hydrolase family protein [Synechococcales cyanobacterium CRU_2_2]|nr:dienelactone hydrolase family protein [Synechococcales cyanobacterium CRU_2_2]
MAVRTTTVQIPNGDLRIEAYFAQPEGDGPFPGILVIQEVFGVNAHIRDVTERIAAEGYLAIAPALYQRTAPGFDVGYDDAALAEGRKYKDMTTAAELLSDLAAAIAYLQNTWGQQLKHRPNGKPALGSIGFCFGGHVAYLAATLPALHVTASFYGAGIATMTPGGGEPTIARTPEIQGTLYACFGTEDPLIPNEQVDAVEQALQLNDSNHRVFRYQGAGHGFFCDRRDSYRADAAADAWEQVKALFEQL